MSNWSIFHHIQHASSTSRKGNFGVVYWLAALSLSAVGIWLILILTKVDWPIDYKAARSEFANPKFAQFHPAVRYWEKDILAWADDFELDPILIATVMQIESCGDPDAISPAGAQGLFQVMPYHFLPGENQLDVQTNAQRGLTYLQQSYHKSEGDIARALAGYNGGHGQIDLPEGVWPEETQRYVMWGFSIYQEAHNGQGESSTLDAWLAAGGQHLCQRASQHLGLP